MTSANIINPFTLWFLWALLQPVVDNNGFNTWATKRRYYLRNVEAVKTRARKYNQTDSRRKWLRAWSAEKQKNDLNYRIGKNLRTRIWFALKAINSQSARLNSKIGCTIPEFRAHLEKQFQPGWTWENWGSVWEIDHKIPCVAFDLTDPAQRDKCFHFSNQRPLSLFDNRSKGAKVNGR